MGKLFAVWGLVVIAGCIGWALNIYKLVTFDGAISDAGGMEIARAIGIFLAPLGAILGFI